MTWLQITAIDFIHSFYLLKNWTIDTNVCQGQGQGDVKLNYNSQELQSHAISNKLELR